MLRYSLCSVIGFVMCVCCVSATWPGVSPASRVITVWHWARRERRWRVLRAERGLNEKAHGKDIPHSLYSVYHSSSRLLSMSKFVLPVIGLGLIGHVIVVIVARHLELCPSRHRRRQRRWAWRHSARPHARHRGRPAEGCGAHWLRRSRPPAHWWRAAERCRAGRGRLRRSRLRTAQRRSAAKRGRTGRLDAHRRLRRERRRPPERGRTGRGRRRAWRHSARRHLRRRSVCE